VIRVDADASFFLERLSVSWILPLDAGFSIKDYGAFFSQILVSHPGV